MNGLFYPQHIFYVKATELAFEDCFHDGDWAEAVNYGTLCLHSYQKYTIGNHNELTAEYECGSGNLEGCFIKQKGTYIGSLKRGK